MTAEEARRIFERETGLDGEIMGRGWTWYNGFARDIHAGKIVDIVPDHYHQTYAFIKYWEVYEVPGFSVKACNPSEELVVAIARDWMR